MIGILIQWDKDGRAQEARRPLLYLRSDEQDGCFSQGDDLLGDGAEDKVARPAAAMCAHDDQVGLELIRMIDDAAGDVVNFRGMNVTLDPEFGREILAGRFRKVCGRFVNAA
jgi:hypothetical protein